jgi:hypothetical protein
MKAEFEIIDGRVVLSDGKHGAILLEDEAWHPCCFYDNGHIDVRVEDFIKPSTAFEFAELAYA